MTNMKKKKFFNCITGDEDNGKYYGIYSDIYKWSDNVDMVFDSRGQYLGIRTCRGKIIDGKFTGKKGIYDFKSFFDLKYWAGRKGSKVDFIETKDGTFIQIRP